MDAAIRDGLKPRFRRFLSSVPGRLHVAAHSHHPWPDATWDAQRQAWLDAAAHQDDKWAVILGEVLPEARTHAARRLSLPDPGTIAFAPNTHDLVRRVLSCLRDRPRVLTTDGEFHSFARQAARLEEAGRLEVVRVPVEPFASFGERFRAAAARERYDLVYLSQVLYESGFVVGDLAELVTAVPDDAYVVIDGYHAFMAVPTDLSMLAGRAFYLAGGYKYAMAGEGACFLHAPPGWGPRPVDTGWFAEPAAPAAAGAAVAYPDDGGRFLGATFDPTALYRFNAVQRMLAASGVSVPDIHAHVQALQRRFLAHVAEAGHPEIGPSTLEPPATVTRRGHFLAFRTPDAAGIVRALRDLDVIADHRGERLRFGFGIYHDEDDVDELCRRIAALPPRGD